MFHFVRWVALSGYNVTNETTSLLRPSVVTVIACRRRPPVEFRHVDQPPHKSPGFTRVQGNDREGRHPNTSLPIERGEAAVGSCKEELMVWGPGQITAISHHSGLTAFQTHSVESFGGTLCAVAGMTTVKNGVRIPRNSK